MGLIFYQQGSNWLLTLYHYIALTSLLAKQLVVYYTNYIVMLVWVTIWSCALL